MIEISDIDDPRIINYRDLRKTPELHSAKKIFIAEGEKVVIKLLESGLQVLSFFSLAEYYEKYKGLIEIKKIPEENRFFADKDLMNNIVGFSLHKGIMAIGKQPPPITLNEITSPLVAMNGIIDSENVGSIIRNCAAFGIKSAVCDGKTSGPYLRRAVRVSMGGVFDVGIHYAENLSATLLTLRDSFGFRIVAAEITEKSFSISDYCFAEKSAIIFGAESPGVDNEILKICNDIIHIPITGSVSSLNVASTSAIFMREISRNLKI